MEHSKSVSELRIRHPQSEDEFRRRDALLQLCLRENIKRPYSIAEEYPFLLKKDMNFRSFCLFSKDRIIAHTNLYERQIGKNYRVGIISNVATDPAFRKQGFSRLLLEQVAEHCHDQGFDALLLWSDLDFFYKKLGYQPFGAEDRFTFAKKISSEAAVRSISQQNLSDAKLAELMTLRPPVETVLRDVGQFREFLTVPDTHVLLYENKSGYGYSIFGKGADLANVIYEYGSSHQKLLPEVVLASVGHVQKIFGEAMVIAPRGLFSFANSSANLEQHPMAWIKRLSEKPVADFYVWGLDSN